MAYVFADEQPADRFQFVDEPKQEGIVEGFVKPTGKALLRVPLHTVASMAQMPVSGMAALGKLISSGGDLNAANKVLAENQGALDSAYLTTPEERQGAENIGFAMKPFQMAGEGGRLIGEATGIPYAAPVLGTLGEAAAMFGLGGAKGAVKGRLDSSFRPMEGIIPETQGRSFAVMPEVPRLVSPEYVKKAFVKEGEVKALPVGQGFELVDTKPKTILRKGEPSYTVGEVNPDLIVENRPYADRFKFVDEVKDIPDFTTESGGIVQPEAFNQTVKKERPAFHEALGITTEPETLNLILSDMKSNLEGGTKGGLQGYDANGDSIYAKSGYPEWFSQLVKDYSKETSSRSGKKESIDAKTFINIIDKGLKGDKLTPRQQGFWEDVNRIAEQEAGKSYAPLVEHFERGKEYDRINEVFTDRGQGGDKSRDRTAAPDRQTDGTTISNLQRQVDSEGVQIPEGSDLNSETLDYFQSIIDAKRNENNKRVNLIHRKTVSEMTPDERATALLTDPLTGQKNKRAYEETARNPIQASIDVDGLKYVNDTFGHDAGNSLLQKVGDALNRAADGENNYHFHGDEFTLEGKTPAEITAIVEKAKQILKDEPLEFNGQKYTADFSHGIAETLAAADKAMQVNKAERKVVRGVNPQETTPKGDLKQTEIPGASERETFNLANPETEISPKLSEQTTPKNTDIPGTTINAGLDITQTKAMLQGLKESAAKSGVVKGIGQEFRSPERVFSKEEAGRKLYEAGDFYDMEKNKFLHKEGTEFETAVKGIKEGSEGAVKIGRALDGDINPAALNPKERGLYTFFKGKFDFLIKEAARRAAGTDDVYKQAVNLANRKEKPQIPVSDLPAGELQHYKGLKTPAEKATYLHEKWKTTQPEGLVKSYDIISRKLSDYLPHIFDKEVLLDEFKQEAISIEDKLRTATNDTAIKGYKERLGQLDEAIKGIEGGKVLTYRALPKNIRFRFFESRTGKEVYSFDAVKAYKTYLTGIARKMFDEPAAKIMGAHAQKLSADMKPYSEWYIRRYLGLNKHPLDAMAGSIASFQWMRTLGLNPRSALVNLTQRLNTIATVGEKYSLKGEKFGFTEEGKKLFDSTGIAAEVPQVLMEGNVAPKLEKVRAVVGYLFNKVELSNRKHAFLSGYLKAKEFLGMSEQAAVKYGVKMVHDTQFRYGRVGMPKVLSSPGGRIALQFWSYPIKQLEFISKLARENPLKVFKWLAYAEGGNYTLQQFLDTDMSNAMGIGLNWGEAFNILKDASKGDIREAFRHARLTFSAGGGGLLPSGPGPTASGALKVAAAAKEGKGMGTLKKEILPVIYNRTKQTVEAIKDEKGGLYPIKNDQGYLTSKLDMRQLIQRTIGPKTYDETQGYLRQQQRTSLDKQRNEIMHEIVVAIADKDYETARKLIRENKIMPTGEAIKNEMLRRRMTREERLRTHKPGKLEAYRYQKEGKLY